MGISNGGSFEAIVSYSKPFTELCSTIGKFWGSFANSTLDGGSFEAILPHSEYFNIMNNLKVIEFHILRLFLNTKYIYTYVPKD